MKTLSDEKVKKLKFSLLLYKNNNLQKEESNIGIVEA